MIWQLPLVVICGYNIPGVDVLSIILSEMCVAGFHNGQMTLLLSYFINLVALTIFEYQISSPNV